MNSRKIRESCVIGIPLAAQPPTTHAPKVKIKRRPAPAEKTALPPAPADPTVPPEMGASCAILMDAVSGQVLFEKHPDDPRPMASTTKIMTALLLCENLSEDDVVTASKNASETKESSLHLKLGEKITAKDMLKAILMRSANDACVAVSEAISGSEAEFVAKMNQRAAELGATHTHFMNSHGLHNEDHYSSARDLAIIARAALKEPRIAEVVCTKRASIVRSSKSKDTLLRNHSRFLGKFPGADGVKTGWTVPAGKCYVGSATQNNWRLIAVVLNSPDYVEETARLMRYGYQNFRQTVLATAGEVVGNCPVRGGEKAEIPAITDAPLQIVVPISGSASVEKRPYLPTSSAPLSARSPLGVLEAVVDGKSVASVALYPQSPVGEARGLARIAGGGIWRSLFVLSIILATSLVSLRYGTRNRKRIASFTKSARRRWRRIAQSLRDTDHSR